VFVTAFRAAGQLNAFVQYSDEQVWNAIQAHGTGTTAAAGDLKTPEYEVFTNPGSAPRSLEFRIREVEPPAAFQKWLRRVVLADRLREVRALIGLPMRAIELIIPVLRAVHPIDDFFLMEFEEQALASDLRGWHPFRGLARYRRPPFCGHRGIIQLSLRLDARKWRLLRKIPSPELGYAGLRFVFLHSFAHALIRQFALECG